MPRGGCRRGGAGLAVGCVASARGWRWSTSSGARSRRRARLPRGSTRRARHAGSTAGDRRSPTAFLEQEEAPRSRVPAPGSSASAGGGTGSSMRVRCRGASEGASVRTRCRGRRVRPLTARQTSRAPGANRTRRSPLIPSPSSTAPSAASLDVDPERLGVLPSPRWERCSCSAATWVDAGHRGRSARRPRRLPRAAESPAPQDRRHRGPRNPARWAISHDVCRGRRSARI